MQLARHTCPCNVGYTGDEAKIELITPFAIRLSWSPQSEIICEIASETVFGLIQSFSETRQQLHMYEYLYYKNKFVVLTMHRVVTLVVYKLQKQVGCFNHRVVFLVADKLETQWLWEVSLSVLKAGRYKTWTLNSGLPTA